MRNKLIHIYGPRSGLGKSTLARALHECLEQLGLPTRPIREEASLELEAFRPYIYAVDQENTDNIDVLIEACEAFIQQCRPYDGVWIRSCPAPTGSTALDTAPMR